MRTRGEKDLAISDGALRLLLRICSFVYVSPKRDFEDCFALPWSQVGIWCACQEQAAYVRIKELISAGYLKCDGLRGCPPTQYFFLVSNSLKNQGIETVTNQGIKAMKKQGNVSTKNQGHHNNNSFQEERFKERDSKSSLRSEYGMGDEIGRDDAMRANGVQVLREFLKTNKRP